MKFLCWLGMAILIATTLGCARSGENLRGPHTSIVDYAADSDPARAGAETRILEGYRERAGLTTLPEAGNPNWWYIVEAGLNSVDEECENYMDAIFWADRELREAGSQISLLGATTATMMGLADASTNAIAATAAGFGLVSQGLANHSNAILYQIDPASIRRIVERSQAAYRAGLYSLDRSIYNSRPASVAAIQGYLSLCLPSSIETQINHAVAATEFKFDIGGANGSPVPTVVPVLTNQQQLAQELEGEKARTQALERQLQRTISQSARPTPQARASDKPQGCQDDECGLVISQAKTIQGALCVSPQSGNFLQLTRAAIRGYEAAEGEKSSSLSALDEPNGILEAKEFSPLLSLSACSQTDFKSAYERFSYGAPGTGFNAPDSGLFAALVNDLERHNGPFEDPKPTSFTAAVRASITKAHQKLQTSTPASDEVTSELLDKM